MYPLSCSDEGVNFAVQKGVEASRSKVRYFHHNDMDHLRRLLEEQHQQDLKVGGMDGSLLDPCGAQGWP